MTCRYLRFAESDAPEEEWRPPGLKDTTCAKRKADPQRCAEVLKSMGVAVPDDGDLECKQNLDGSWQQCPLFEERRQAEVKK
jgi:hypothetical protein